MGGFMGGAPRSVRGKSAECWVPVEGLLPARLSISLSSQLSKFHLTPGLMVVPVGPDVPPPVVPLPLPLVLPELDLVVVFVLVRPVLSFLTVPELLVLLPELKASFWLLKTFFLSRIILSILAITYLP